MSKYSIRSGAIVCVFLSLPALLYSLTAEEIIKRMESNQIHETSRSTGLMKITDRFGTRVKTFTSFSEGEEKSLIEFTNPEEAGQKILRTDDKIYLYFPEAEDIIRLQGAALKDSVMGSDFSYEDMTGGKGLLDSYTVSLEGQDLVRGSSCYRIRLEAIKKDVVYPIQVMWVDTEKFIYLRVMQYSLKGRELKEMNILDYREIAGKNVPVKFELQDKMKKNSKTEFEVEEMEIGIPLEDGVFSLEGLTW